MSNVRHRNLQLHLKWNGESIITNTYSLHKKNNFLTICIWTYGVRYIQIYIARSVFRDGGSKVYSCLPWKKKRIDKQVYPDSDGAMDGGCCAEIVQYYMESLEQGGFLIQGTLQTTLGLFHGPVTIKRDLFVSLVLNAGPTFFRLWPLFTFTYHCSTTANHSCEPGYATVNPTERREKKSHIQMKSRKLTLVFLPHDNGESSRPLDHENARSS